MSWHRISGWQFFFSLKLLKGSYVASNLNMYICVHIHTCNLNKIFAPLWIKKTHFLKHFPPTFSNLLSNLTVKYTVVQKKG